MNGNKSGSLERGQNYETQLKKKISETIKENLSIKLSGPSKHSPEKLE